jgi:hypothetical protein
MPADDLSKLQHATAMARKRKGPSQGLLSAFQNEILTGLRVDVRANRGGALSMPVHSYRNDAEARGGVSRHPRRRLWVLRKHPLLQALAPLSRQQARLGRWLQL